MSPSNIDGWTSPAFRFGGVGASPLVAHSDVVTASMATILAAIIPTGTVRWSFEATAVSGWVLGDGSALSRTDYPALNAMAAAAGYPGLPNWGPGDGTSTFNVPDLRGRVPVGAGTGSGLTARALGASFGEEVHVLSVGEMAAHDHGNTTTEGSFHTHPQTTRYTTNASHNHAGVGGGVAEAANPDSGVATGGGSTGNETPTHVHGTNSTGSSTAHNVMQPSIALNPFIKT